MIDDILVINTMYYEVLFPFYKCNYYENVTRKYFLKIFPELLEILKK